MSKHDFWSDDGTGQFDEIYDKLQSERASKRLSPSALNTLLQCSRQYWFKYILGWKISGKGLALSLGSSVHAGFEYFNREQALDRKVELEDIYGEFDAFWENDIQGLVQGEHYRTEKELGDNYEMGIGLIEKYWNSIRRKQMAPTVYRPPSTNIEIPAVEMRIEVPFVDLFTDKMIDSEYEIMGYVDVVKEVKRTGSNLEKGDLCILDYKTTAREYSDFKLKTLIQLLIYAYAMRFLIRNYDMFPGMKKDKEDFVGIIELLKRKTDKSRHAKTRLISVTDEQIQYLQGLIKDSIAMIRNGIFLPNYSDMCGWCDFKEPCLMMGMGKDPKEWWEKNRYKNKGGGKRVTVS